MLYNVTWGRVVFVIQYVLCPYCGSVASGSSRPGNGAGLFDKCMRTHTEHTPAEHHHHQRRTAENTKVYRTFIHPDTTQSGKIH